MANDSNYFYGLSENIKSLISGALKEKERDWLSFSRKAPEIVLSGPGPLSEKLNLQLQFLGFDVIGEAEGTFVTTTDDSNDVLVYRVPCRISASYLLRITDVDLRESFKLFDGLCAHFFNKKSIDPFVPEAFKAVPELHAKMTATRADISLKKAGAATEGSGYEMRFEYRGLYHSGDPIRSEKRVKQRVIQMNKNEEGQS